MGGILSFLSCVFRVAPYPSGATVSHPGPTPPPNKHFPRVHGLFPAELFCLSVQAPTPGVSFFVTAIGTQVSFTLFLPFPFCVPSKAH